ncbi:MAG: MnhB domain-containing protein [Pseudomonadota bacterium]
MTTPILKAASRILVAIMLVFSFYVLLRGHNEPGGGFIGGLIGAAAFSLITVSHGVETARRTLWLDPLSLAGLGVAAALLAGLISLPAGVEPFSGLWIFLGADGGGQGVPVSTVLLFDIGVWLVVVGAALALVFALEETAPHPRSQRDTQETEQ